MSHDLRNALPAAAFASPKRPERNPYAPGHLLNTKDVAVLLGVSLKWVYDTFSIPDKGGVQPVRIAGMLRWRYEDVQAWIEAHR